MNIPELYEWYKKNPSVQTDTRHLKEGDIFFALKGPNFNGNKFAQQAIDQGASAAIIDDAAFEIPGKTVLVTDVLDCLQQLAKFHRERLSELRGDDGLPFIAITGSNGKTTTKELIHAVLSTTFRTYTTQGNLNNHIGVPLTILRIADDAQMAVIEMGANHIGEIASYCQIAFPTHGLITNCGKAHLEGFGSEEGVRKAKGELFDYLRTLTHGYAFVMWDYSYLQEMSRGISGVIKYGTLATAHIIGRVAKNDPFLEVEITQGMKRTFIKTQLVGEYNLPNVLAAVTVGTFFKVAEENIKHAIERYAPSNSRSQLLEKGTNKIILDAYNANPSSMKLAIENFARMPGDKILILGSMAELGKQSEEEHRALVSDIEKHPWKAVVLVGNEFQKISHPFVQFADATETARWLKDQNFQNSSMLVKGSRSMQMEKAIGV